MASGAVLVWPVLAFVVMMVLMLIFLASRYKRCPSDKILVIYGSGPGMKGRTAKTMHGGGALIWPLVQNYAFLDLKPIRDGEGALAEYHPTKESGNGWVKWAIGGWFLFLIVGGLLV